MVAIIICNEQQKQKQHKGEELTSRTNYQSGMGCSDRSSVSRREHDFWMNNPDVSRLKLPPDVRERFVRTAQSAVNGLKGKWELIAGGDQLIEGVEFIDAPGHTPGHMMVAFTSGDDRLVNFGDSAHHHAVSFQHPDWPMAFDADAALGAATRRKVLDRLAQERARVFGVHMPFPSLGHVRSAAGTFEYIIEPWQSA